MVAALLATAVLVGTSLAAQDTDDRLARRRGHERAATSALTSGDLEAACVALVAAIDLQPDHVGLRLDLAQLLLRQGDAEAACAQLADVARRGAGPPADRPQLIALLEREEMATVRARFATNLRPVGEAVLAFRLPRPRLLPECVAHDPHRDRWFVGGVHTRELWVRDAQGEASVLAGPEEGLSSVFGLVVDAERRLLWLSCSVAEPMQPEPPPDPACALVQFDLESDEILDVFPLDRPGCVLGSVALDPSGAVYLSDSLHPDLYRWSDETGLRPWLEAGPFGSLQGLCVDAERGALFVADYSQGVLRIGLQDREPRLLAVPVGTTLLGIDGLACWQDSLIAVQNGVRPHRILRLQLDEAGGAITELSVLSRGHALHDEPTQGTVLGGNYFYVANSQWPAFERGRPRSGAPLREPAILNLPLR